MKRYKNAFLRILYRFVIFMAGGVVFLNLNLLIRTHPDYQASWFNIIAALLITIIFIGLSWNTPK